MSKVILMISLVLILATACGGQLTPSPTPSPTLSPTPINTPESVPTVESAPPTATVPPTAAPSAAENKAILFDLGDAVLVQDKVPEQVRDMPVRLEGLIAMPALANGELPLAIIMHGSHGSGCPSPDGMTENWPCPATENKNYAGFAYLLEALARQGYIALSINANPAYVMAYGEAQPNSRLPKLLDLYLERIAAATNGQDMGLNVDLTGRVDWNRLVILGHSQGGEAVNWIVDGRADHTNPDQINAGLGPIAAAVLLAPQHVDPDEPEMAVPQVIILPACDRDVANLAGQYYYESARQKAQRDDPALSVYLVGANHNRFNSVLSDDDLSITRVICDEEKLLSPDAQQNFLTRYVPRFFDAALGRGDGDLAAIGLDAAQPAPSQILDRQVLTSLALPAAQRLRLPMTAASVQGSATAVYCESGWISEQARRETCRRNQYNQPGEPEDYVISWNGQGSAYEVAVPEASHDVSAYDMLHLRAAVDPLSQLTAAGQSQSFSLRLTDRAGQTATINLADEPALAFPAGQKGFDDSSQLDTWDNHVILSSIRVPLSKFSGVDLSNIQAVTLVFDATDSGSIFVTDLEFLKTNE